MATRLTFSNFWLWWVAAGNIGFLVGSVLGVLPFLLFKLSQTTLAFEAVTGAVIGGGIAGGQLLVLRRQLPVHAVWILTGVVGLGIANTFGAAFCICWAGFVYPLITAGLQVLILWKSIAMPWLWLVAGVMGMLAGGSFGEFYPDAPWLPFAYVTASSAVTGFALMQLAAMRGKNSNKWDRSVRQ